MASSICVDVGGTFTDLAFFDENRTIGISKSPTTPKDYPEGIENCVDLVAEDVGVPARKLLEECAHFTHGSTIITNAVVEGKVAKVGFLVTRGFRDILTLREGGKEDCYNIHEDYPKPYVPRYLTLPVTERINAEGGIEIPLDETDAIKGLQTLIETYKVDAVAVCFLWSIANPVHEQRIKEIVARNWPNTTCVLSSETNPIIREYRRASSTVIEASVRPVAEKYMHDIDLRLKKKGYQGTLYMITSSGAVLTAEEAGKRGLALIASGPAMAPVGAQWFAAMEGDRLGNLIVTDMGGTSFDISLVTNGEVARTRESKVGDETLGISTIDSRSIGAGGGSIAWIDPGGLIHVGPESAGAMPGPACYNRGGKKATVTDANVVLGYIDPNHFLGGRMKIEPQLAERAVTENIAKALGLEVNEAAFTIWSTVNVDMVSAIQDVTIWQGIDPREYSIVSGGGAGNCHVVALAKDLGVKRSLVPKYGGVLSAVGGLVADVCADFSGSHFTTTSSFDYEGVNSLLERLENESRSFLSRFGATSNNSRIEFSVEARYSYQVWELSIQLSGQRISNEQDVLQLTEDFHKAHERVFAIKEPGQSVECVHWSARAIVQMPELKLREQPEGGAEPSAALMPEREAYFREMGGMVKTQIYRGDGLTCGNVLEGPAIIEESTTTIVIPPATRATVTKYGDYWIETED